MRRYLVPVLILVGLAIAAVVAFLIISNSQPASTTTYTVRRGSLNAVVRTTGKLEPSRASRLSFRTSDVIRKVYVKLGDVVAAGMLLMELDDSRLQRELTQAESQRDIARLNLSAAQERGRFQGQTAPTPTASPLPTPTPPLTPSGTPPAIPPVSDQYVPVKQLEQAEQAYNQARANLETAKLYAPFDGTVLTVDANEGDVIGTGAAVATFADLNSLQVRADVDEIDVANVAVGQLVQFTLDAFPGKSFEGRVASIAPNATQRQGSTVYSSVISFTRPANVPIRPGMAANLTIVSQTKTNILIIPNRALETIGARKYVNRVVDENRTEKIPVEVGLTSGDQTEIISGLSENDRISIPK